MSMIWSFIRVNIIVLVLLVAVAVHFMAGLRMMHEPKITFGDGIEYLNTAYHIRHDWTFTSSGQDVGASPEIGREPAYPMLLAVLMGIDDSLASYHPACADPATACDPTRFRLLSVVNLLLIETAGLIAFVLTGGVTGSKAGGLVGAGYILLNVSLLRSHWYDPMSDDLALVLVAGAMLALQKAWGRDEPARWCVVGLTLAALTLTKAVFLPFGLGLGAVAVGRRLPGMTSARRAWRMPLIAMLAYTLVVGGWAMRNWQVSGMPRLTDGRGGIALSTREVFDHMTPAQIAAAFVYWTPGGGSDLAKRLFSPDTVAPFELYAPGGFYDRGQNGYGRRVEALMRSGNLDVWQARSAIDHAVVGEILTAPVGFLASLPPLVYRGLWADSFALVSLPSLLWMLWRAIRRRKGLPALLLSFGLFNETFYALFSLNIPRYQITAMPALALATAMMMLVVARHGGASKTARRLGQWPSRRATTRMTPPGGGRACRGDAQGEM